jgi:hypothetical protein
MAKVISLLLLLVLALAIAGCESEQPRGDREFIPGKGWVPVQK